MAKSIAEEARKLVQRGLERFERGDLQGAASDWETAARVDRANLQARRLAEFGQEKLAKLEAGETTAYSRRDTMESPIPQFLAALSERKSESAKVKIPPDAAAPQAPHSGAETRKVLGKEKKAKGDDAAEARVPDTLEDLRVHEADVRASTVELIAECRAALNQNRGDAASLAAELALQVADRAPPPGVDDLVEPSRALFERAFRACLGNLQGFPLRAVLSESLTDHGFDHRAAFLMSRMDGASSLVDILDASGMARFDAIRLLAALYRSKIIEILPG